jgi:hypothetical protein
MKKSFLTELTTGKRAILTGNHKNMKYMKKAGENFK